MQQQQPQQERTIAFEIKQTSNNKENDLAAKACNS